MEETNELIQERIKKLNKLKDSGVDPYGEAFDAKHKAADIAGQFGRRRSIARQDNTIKGNRGGAQIRADFQHRARDIVGSRLNEHRRGQFHEHLGTGGSGRRPDVPLRGVNNQLVGAPG